MNYISKMKVGFSFIIYLNFVSVAADVLLLQITNMNKVLLFLLYMVCFKAAFNMPLKKVKLPNCNFDLFKLKHLIIFISVLSIALAFFIVLLTEEYAKFNEYKFFNIFIFITLITLSHVYIIIPFIRTNIHKLRNIFSVSELLGIAVFTIIVLTTLKPFISQELGTSGYFYIYLISVILSTTCICQVKNGPRWQFNFGPSYGTFFLPL